MAVFHEFTVALPFQPGGPIHICCGTTDIYDATLFGGDDQDNNMWGDSLVALLNDPILGGSAGGDDTLSGADKVSLIGPMDNYIVGDAEIMRSDFFPGQITIFGGNDTLVGGQNFTSFDPVTDSRLFNLLFGDAFEMSGDGVLGGNDHLTGGADFSLGGFTANRLHGDAAQMHNSSLGGQDILIGGNLQGTATTIMGLGFHNNLFGDAQEMTTGAIGGADFLIQGGDNSGHGAVKNFIYGDAEIMGADTVGGDDGTPVAATALEEGLRGGDNYSNSSADTVKNEMYGDGALVSTEAQMGNDWLYGGDARGTGKVDNDLYGDAGFLVGVTAPLIPWQGGNDFLKGGDTFGGVSSELMTNALVGDVVLMDGNARGGVDHIFGGSALVSGTFGGSIKNVIYGDGVELTDNAIGGDDKGSFGGLEGGDNRAISTVTNDIFGDANTLSGNATGGDDFLRGGSTFRGGTVVNNLYGDSKHISDGATAGNDRLVGGNADHGTAENNLYGNGGTDTLIGGNSLQTGTLATIVINNLWGGAGIDTIIAGRNIGDASTSSVTNFIHGESGDDDIFVKGADTKADNVGGGPDQRQTFIDGGEGKDTFHVSAGIDNDPATVAGHFYIETVLVWEDPAERTDKVSESLLQPSLTEIVVSYSPSSDGSVDSKIVAELVNIEEMFIDAERVVQPSSDPVLYTITGDPIVGFDNTALDVNTITINGATSGDVVDLSGLVSAHGVDLISNGGNDKVIGAKETTTVLLPGDFQDYEQILNPDGSITLRLDADNSLNIDGDVILQDEVSGGMGDFNISAFIGGVMEGEVTEDTATLSTTGQLTITDIDDPATFQEGPYDSENGHGILELSEDGYWSYFVFNASQDVQDLVSGGLTLEDEVKVLSADGTEATIEITINGTDEPKGNVNGEAFDGTVEIDNITTGNGGDVVTALSGNDVISTGNQDDFVQAGWGNDTVHGGNGSDTILGDDGNDTLFGEDGKDIIDGGRGVDEIHGGNGKDILTGGLDPDTFVFELDGALDTVTDLEIGADGLPIDHIGLVDGLAFADLTIENYKKGGVVISVDGTDEMLIENVADATQITDGFFINA